MRVLSRLKPLDALQQLNGSVATLVKRVSQSVVQVIVTSYGPVDQNGRRYGLPIEKAKEEILKQGLPVRGQAADSRKQ